MTYQILGINQDSDNCSCCGKTNLNRVVWLKDSNGEINHYGTICAGRLIGNTRVKNTAERCTLIQKFKDFIDNNQLDKLSRYGASIQNFGGFKAIWRGIWLVKLGINNEILEYNPNWINQ